jgi:hypothetical protein
VNQDVVIAIIRYKAASWRGFAHKQSSRHAHVSVNSDLKTAQFHFWRQGSSHATHYTLPSFFVWALLFTLNIKLYCSARDRHESISDRAQVVMGWRRPRDANGNDAREKRYRRFGGGETNTTVEIWSWGRGIWNVPRGRGRFLGSCVKWDLRKCERRRNVGKRWDDEKRKRSKKKTEVGNETN